MIPDDSDIDEALDYHDDNKKSYNYMYIYQATI